MILNYNPDVLNCLANLSNDEVFTPPELANQILDLLPNDLWSNPSAKFLDPVCKSGVFLREIAKRLDHGLRAVLPEQSERINHIMKYQVFGLAITELTALLSRRTVYCSKAANGKYSICEDFGDEQGNIIYQRLAHTWRKGKCVFCGANEKEYERDEALETYAYPFIHCQDPGELFKGMKFDVIVGNPPYQLSDGGAKASAIPLYHKFIQQAKKLSPRFLIMIVPSRWFAGGRGLDNFREEMLHDTRIRKIFDYPNSTECFPGIDISGGICYFLWDRDNRGMCEITTIMEGKFSVMERPLLEHGLDTFIRYNQAISILRKIHKFEEDSFIKFVSSQKPFGLRTYAKGKKEPFSKSIKLYGSTGITYISRDEVSSNVSWIDKYKVYISRAYGERISKSYWVIGKPFLGEPNSCCSETYLVVGTYSNEEEANSIMRYMRTRFFRFLVLLKKNTQDAPQKVYAFVPIQDFTQTWTDEKLYAKYGLTAEEIAFIESMVRPMELDKPENVED